MKVLVTGGAGFIGSNIVDELIKENFETIAVDNLAAGNMRNLPKDSVFYKADICENLDQVFMAEKPDIVIHQAAQVSVTKSMSDPVYDGHINVIGTVNLLNTCVKHGVKKFIFSSSAAVYGSPQYLPIDESHPSAPISPYGISKQCAEQYIQLFSSMYHLPYTILRYSNVFGPRQDVNGEAGVIAIFIEKLVKGDIINIYGDGLQTRDFVFVKDVARANIAALTSGENSIINIGSQSQVPIVEVFRRISQILNVEVSPNYSDERPGDIKHSILSKEYAEKALKWLPKYSFSAGLKETIKYYQGLL
ncbi:NAD-dependent epimerase/dehydratase family protein [Mesobacillus boroniphilus]|uniref:NAD-dependent epimerase/dehydratase family protein n=1 Tax=Mesobacillus boroniphilus TaxID=308892 RepID=A0A944GZ98_9BACI|nr:NAD-dependent epimerase/dehydratase family protein [Mesobacillus boroniphilus]MBS8266605.1 NAD-dependent epimerase/dehydratase family protein [Mesobacillus boroniphilus]